MRIVNVMISKSLGGIEQAFLDYTQALKLHQHEVCAVVSRKCQILDTLQNLHPARIEQISFVHYNYLLAFYLYWRLKDFAPDVIIVHNKKAINIFKMVAKLLKCKIVAVSHNPKFKHVNKCDGIFTITDYQRNIFIKKGYPAQNIYTIPNLISQKRAYEQPQFHRPPVIGTMGRFDPMKGFPDFVAALVKLKQQGVVFKAIIGGGVQSAYRSEYEKICRMIEQNNMQKEISLIGWVNDKTEFFNSIDVFVLPSRFEPFGIVLLEAMLYGKPVVSSLAEGPTEIFARHNEAAYLFAVEDIDGMAKQMKEAVTNQQQAAQKSYNGYQLCVQNYSLEVVADKLNNALNNFLFGKEGS